MKKNKNLKKFFKRLSDSFYLILYAFMLVGNIVVCFYAILNVYILSGINQSILPFFIMFFLLSNLFYTAAYLQFCDSVNKNI